MALNYHRPVLDERQFANIELINKWKYVMKDYCRAGTVIMSFSITNSLIVYQTRIVTTEPEYRYFVSLEYVYNVECFSHVTWISIVRIRKQNVSRHFNRAQFRWSKFGKQRRDIYAKINDMVEWTTTNQICLRQQNRFV